ncbi:MAG: aldehyde dehydrogenase, partial [Anaerolineae bacterium]|nr:aldehyde dehydrogenase [Anaerolineae bacterium]
MAKKLFIDGHWQTTTDTLTVCSPYDQHIVSDIHAATPADVAAAIESAWKARSVMAALTAAERGQILDKLSSLLSANREEIAQIITAESGKG